ncbi:MAG: restriction endonuclease subunit S [Fibrobacterota bacterium]
MKAQAVEIKSTKWPMVRLDKIFLRTSNTIVLQAETEYREITVKLWGKGVILRGMTTGASLAGQRRFVAKAGQFILSRIDARNGALGLVPPCLDGAVVSNDFPLFSINEDFALPCYVDWMSKTVSFVEMCQRASEGTTNRVRLQEDVFLQLEIPLPPLDEQRRIVARIEELAAKINEAKTLRQQAVEEAKAILTSCLHQRFVIEENAWPVGTVGDAAEIIDPNPSHRMPRYADEGIPFISTVDFQGTEDIRRRTAKHVDESTYKEQVQRCSFCVGDVLYTRIGSIGTARILKEIWPFALSHVLVVVKPKSTVLPRFLLWYLRSDSIVSQASDATRSVGVPDLGIKRVRDFHMPLPPMPEQEQIVGYFDGLLEQIESLSQQQSESAAELDALLPALLDRAFKGAL